MLHYYLNRILDRYVESDFKADVVKHPISTTPYENGPIVSAMLEEKFPFDIRDSETDDAIETPIIARTFTGQYQTPDDVLNTVDSYNSNVSPKRCVKRTASLFSSDDNEEDVHSPTNINSEVYDVVLRDFLTKYYPVNNDVIREMIIRNLLLPEDALIILSVTSNQEKSQSFLDNFVFSEANICKLATFLYVLITERPQALADFKKSMQYFREIVDHMYYVVNIISLFSEYSGTDSTLIGEKYISSMINVNSVQSLKVVKKTSSTISERTFYIKIFINNFVFPSRLWCNFAAINRHYRCCQELTLSSCDLQPDDIRNLCKGFMNIGSIRLLDVSTNPITDEGLKYLEELFVNNNFIDTINISCCSLTSTGVESFLEILSLKGTRSNLKHLNISHNDLRDMTERHVLILTKIPLTTLEIKSINTKHQRSLFQCLKLNYSLKSIHIGGNKLLTNDITFLAAGIAYNTRLKTISLKMMGVLQSDCVLLNNTLLMNKCLVSIDLSDNCIGDGGAEILKDILTMKRTLKYIYLKRCGISHIGTLMLIKKASEVECCVTVLDLCYNYSVMTINSVSDVQDVVRQIIDLVDHITLVKDIRIILWGTLDKPDFKNYFEL